MKKLTPGKERPFTTAEFGDIIAKLAKEQKFPYFDRLDYCIANRPNDLPMDSPWVTFIQKTDFGGSEGIYSDIYVVDENRKETSFLTAKTLCEGEDAYVEMNTLAARIVVLCRKFLNENCDDFAWHGYDVGVEKEDRSMDWRHSCLENFTEVAEEYKKGGQKVFVRENSTRRVFDYQ